MNSLTKILSIILITLLISCNQQHKIYKTTDKDGYCYHDNGLWYVYYLNSNGSYYYYGSQTSYPSYDNSTTYSWSPSSETVSNYNEVPVEAQSVTESTGQDVGVTDSSNDSNGSGMSESSGSDSGGSDSGSSDSGSSDGVGGDGGGGE